MAVVVGAAEVGVAWLQEGDHMVELHDLALVVVQLDS